MADFDQEHAREQLLAVTRSSGEAVAGTVQAVAILVRSAVPAGVTNPEAATPSPYPPGSRDY